MLYLYALTEHPAVLPRAPGGLAAEPLDGIDAVVGVIEDEDIEPSEEEILRHARVVEELAAVNSALLPARFGLGFSDAAALQDAVAERADGLSEALGRVRGCVELGVRVLSGSTSTVVPVGGSGRDYMLGRLDERRRAERLADELHGPLAALARADSRSVAATPELLLSAAYLVPHETVERFRALVDELGRANADLTIACTGPWPPYSFVTANVGRR